MFLIFMLPITTNKLTSLTGSKYIQHNSLLKKTRNSNIQKY